MKKFLAEHAGHAEQKRIGQEIRLSYLSRNRDSLKKRPDLLSSHFYLFCSACPACSARNIPDNPAPWQIDS